MKKILTYFLMAAILICPYSAFAADADISLDVSVDYLKNITTVTANVGEIYADRRVNVIILNPGFTISDLTAKTDGAVNWAEQTYVGDDGKFLTDLSLTPAEDGNNPTYTAIAAVDTMNNVLSKTFELYNNNYVDGVLSKIKDALKAKDKNKITELTTQYAGLLGIQQTAEYEIYTNYDEQLKLRAAEGLIYENPQTVAEYKDSFVLVVKTIQLGNITDKDEYGTEFMQLTDDAAASVKAKLKSLTDDEKSKLIDAFMAEDFDSPHKLIDKLNEIFVLGGINSSKLWTEVAAVYEEYNDVLNVNIDEYNALKDKQTPMASLIGKDFKTVQTAKDAYNNAVSAQKAAEASISKKGGSSGGGGKGSSTVTGPAESINNQPNTNYGNTIKFTDLAGYEWAQDDINTLVGMGIINGYPDNTFAPGRQITRAEFTKLFVAAFGTNGNTAPINFTDVKPNDWFYDSVKAAYGCGYIQGISNDTFAPNDFVTREDMAVMICRYLGINYDKKAQFADLSDISYYAEEAVYTLAQAGIMNGFEDNSFGPQKSALRAEVSSVIVRALAKKGVQ